MSGEKDTVTLRYHKIFESTADNPIDFALVEQTLLNLKKKYPLCKRTRPITDYFWHPRSDRSASTDDNRQPVDLVLPIVIERCAWPWLVMQLTKTISESVEKVRASVDRHGEKE